MFKRPSSRTSSSRRSLSVYSGHAAHTTNFVIPPALSFENVMENKTCPPCTEKNFLEFCRYVDFTEENLLFYLWVQDYQKRFAEKQGTSDLALAPEWTVQMQEDAIQAAINTTKANLASRKAEIETNTTELFAGTDFEKSNPKLGTGGSINPFATPPRTSASSVPGSVVAARMAPRDRTEQNPWDALGRVSENPSQKTADSSVTIKELAQETFQSSGVLAPFSIQPFREEVNRIVVTYLRSASPRQLNLSNKEQFAALRALQYTTHPSAFAAISITVEASLRQTHKRFIRHALCNGNPARIVFARSLGIFLVVAGFVLAILLTLSKVGRGWRAMAALPWLLGTSTFLTGMKGMCVVLHGLHHRHLRPWQLFEENNSDFSLPGKFSHRSNSSDVETGTELKNSSDLSIETFSTPISLEDYPWVAKYEKRNLVRKIFDRERWIQEPALRQLQDRVFFESLAWATAFTVPMLVLFVPLPGGHFF